MVVTVDFSGNSVVSRALPLLARVSRFLVEQGIDSYLVGGFVRDALLGRDTGDIDIAVAADALEVAPRVAAFLGGKYVPLDKVNRVGRVLLTDSPREVDFSTFHGGIEQDLGRRDFTIDAVAVDLRQLQDITSIRLIDPFNGCEDLRQGIIRAVADTAFESDAIRSLRGARLAAELGFRIDKQTEDLIRRYSHLLSHVAGERVREELLRILAVPQEQLLSYLDRLGLLTAVIPELAQMKGVNQPREHFWDVFDHSLNTVVAVDFLLRQGKWQYAGGDILAHIPWSEVLAQHFDQAVGYGSTRRILLKLAALLHDIAKPQTRAAEASGRVRFLGHPQEGATIAADILERLRFSTREIKQVEILVQNHLRPLQMSHEGPPSARAVYRFFRDTGEAGVDVLFLCLSDHLAARGPNLNLVHWREHNRLVEYILAQREQQEGPVASPKLIGGHDFINLLGMSPSRQIGELLEAVREAQAAGELTTREEALAYVRDRLVSKAV
ncbi:CCA tRNA nucleotidyltransferase [Chloroflexota bacterium]